MVKFLCSSIFTISVNILVIVSNNTHEYFILYQSTPDNYNNCSKVNFYYTLLLQQEFVIGLAYCSCKLHNKLDNELFLCIKLYILDTFK